MRIRQKHWWSFLLLTAFLTLAALATAQAAEGAQVSGLVWLEKSVDGVYNNESGFAGARVTLERRLDDGSEMQLATMETERDGAFAFSVAEAGEYRLSIELPADYLFTLHGGASSALPAQGSLSSTPYFTLADGQFAVKNIGVTKTSSYVSLIAFEDENANGGRMLSEPLIRDVQAEVIYEFEGQTYLIAADTTDRQGEASIRNLSPGTYRLRVTLPENYVIGPLGQKINTYYNCILASADNTGLSAPFALEAKSSVGMGIGAVRTGSLAGKIWWDENANGLWDAEETGMTEAVISLHSDALGITRDTRADENGDYAFRGLQPGDYRLIISLPEGRMFTYGSQSLITDGFSAEAGVNVSVQVETTAALGAVGVMPATSLSLALYQDENVNGARDEGEQPVADALVSLIQSGKTLITAVSDESGIAYFPLVRGGDLTLSCTLPNGYVFTIAGEDALFPVRSALMTAERSLSIPHAQHSEFSAGVTRSCGVTGMLFEDPANTGIFQGDCAPLAGFTVQAVNDQGEAVLEAITDETGRYVLDTLLPGEYTVRFLLTEQYVAAPYVADQGGTFNRILNQTPEYGETDAFTLAPGQLAEGMDGGVFRAGMIDGRVLLDANHDGLATSEGGLAGVMVTLLDEYGAPFSDFSYGLTDENGYFYIKGALPGVYSLLYTLPADSAFTQPMTEQTEIESESFTIGSGSEIHMPDVGAVSTATLSGFVLHATENGNWPVSAQVTLTAQAFGTVYETQTLEDGQYILSGLRPDTYALSVQLPEGYVFADAAQSPVAGTADRQATAQLAFSMGETRLDANIYAALPADLNGVLYYDANRSGARDADESSVEGRSFTLWLRDAEIADLTTDENGAFTLENLVPGEYTLRLPAEENEIVVGASVPEADDWMVPLTLHDGAQTNFSLPLLRYASVSGQVWSLDGTLSGVSGIPVTLLDQGSGAVISTTATNAQGEFSFEQLLPGEYALSATLPTGYLFARAQDAIARESYIISQPDGTAQALPLSVLMGDELSGMDIGMGSMGGIGDRAWLDENGNGMQDLDEPNMPGILIELYQHGEWIASATTDVYGHYAINGLYPGEYEMRVTMHAELKATTCQTDFPLVASILPESSDTTVTVENVIVPSGSRALHYDLGFTLRKKGVYPAAMDEIPAKDWRPYSER